MIWNKSCECMSREELRELQGKRLRDVVDQAEEGLEVCRMGQECSSGRGRYKRSEKRLVK